MTPSMSLGMAMRLNTRKIGNACMIFAALLGGLVITLTIISLVTGYYMLLNWPSEHVIRVLLKVYGN